ncbi:hypothetical protein, partial [Escherichia coli]|uniref:hypothetical protein n=1 Tax=Escherichia coli TaxID=562 RepID=UPI0025790A28
IVDLVLKKMRQEGRTPLLQRGSGYPRAYVCGVCSGNHPTGSCQREGNALYSGLIWCDICKKYGTHSTDNCYYRARVLNQQNKGDQRNYQPQGNPSVGGNADKPIPVLGTQPPLPGAAAVRYVDVASNERPITQSLIPVGSYYEEEYNFHDYPSDPSIEDHQELMIVGQRPNNFGRGQPPMGRGRGFSTQGLGPCFHCGGDHWARECPRDKPGMAWPRVERFCPGCHIDHLSKDCPSKPAKQDDGPPTSSPNIVEVIQSPPTSGTDEIASLRVVTRAQAKSGVPLDKPESSRKSPKKKKRRRKG